MSMERTQHRVVLVTMWCRATPPVSHGRAVFPSLRSMVKVLTGITRTITRRSIAGRGIVWIINHWGPLAKLPGFEDTPGILRC